MTEPQQTPEPKLPVQHREVSFKPFGGADEIRLSMHMIRTQIAVPYKMDDGTLALPDDRQCLHFMMLCKARQLNPFEGDSFMIPFWDRDMGAPKWNLVTAIQSFLKRAEVHPDYDGKESGIIVNAFRCKPCKGEGYIVVNSQVQVCPMCHGEGVRDELPGDFMPEKIDGEPVRLLGGWCKVFYRQKRHPEYQRLKLSTYQKSFGVWKQDSPGMICKCAEAAALRSAFPTTCGGMYLREEIQAHIDVESEPVFSRPDFGRAQISAGREPTELEKALAKPPTQAAQEPEKVPMAIMAKPKQAAQVPKAQKPHMAQVPTNAVQGEHLPEPPPDLPDEPPQPPPPLLPTTARVQSVRLLCRANMIKEPELIGFVKQLGAVPDDCNTLEQVQAEAPQVMDMIHDQFPDIVKRMAKLKGKA